MNRLERKIVRIVYRLMQTQRYHNVMWHILRCKVDGYKVIFFNVSPYAEDFKVAVNRLLLQVLNKNFDIECYWDECRIKR